MKTRFRLSKRIISAVMIIVMMIITISSASAAFDADGKCDCSKDPLVYVIGRSSVYVDPTADEKVNAIHFDKTKFAKAYVQGIPTFFKGVMTDDWDDYCDDFCALLTPVFEDYKLSNEGTITNDSGVLYKWSPETVNDNHQSDSVYSYEFRYDPRIDPWEIADDLNNYIETVKKVTGHDKINLLSRCMGTSIAMSYLVKYASKDNYEGISKFVIYNGTLNGFSFASDAFTGRLTIDPDSCERFIKEWLGDDYLNEFIKASVEFLNQTKGLDLAADLVEKIYAKIADKVVSRLLVDTYATTPGYWTMINDASYEDAKDYVFKGDTSTYGVLMDKLDNYHYKVQVNNINTLLAMKSAGVNISIICKYGYQNMPFIEEYPLQSDGTVDLASQAFGVTCTDYMDTFSDEYLASADMTYVSPDKQVDASTCLFPDSTWFIKNVEHVVFPNGTSPLLVAICRYDGQMTVNSDEKYPQYLLYDEASDSITPLTEENCQTRDYGDENVLTSLINFVKALYNLIVGLINNSKA